MTNSADRQPPWHLYLAEGVGTALLVLVGLSMVILMFGEGSPVAAAIPDAGFRRLVTGFLFGTTGALIALSPIGRISGAHVNPVVTLAFALICHLEGQLAVGYIASQLLGACAGSIPLLAWGAMGRSVAFGATLPGQGYTMGAVFMGEAITTFAMISGLCVFLGSTRLRRFTPAMFPFLYAVMVFAEAPVSGTSTNPARSLGPSLVSGQWSGWWIYWLGPLAGMLAAAFAFGYAARRIQVAKLYHFDVHHWLLRRRGGVTA